MGAGLHADEQGGAARALTRFFERQAFGMPIAKPMVVPAADHLVAGHDNGADHRIGAGETARAGGQPNAFFEVATITQWPGL